MKKFFLTTMVLFAMSTMASAQIQTVGARFGGGQGYNAELSAQWGFCGQRLETDLGWYSNKGVSALSLSGIYHWMYELDYGFSWYVGVGGHLGMWFADHTSDISLGVMGQAGIEYNFDEIPLQLSLDLRPCFYLNPNTDLHWGDIAFGIRYRF